MFILINQKFCQRGEITLRVAFCFVGIDKIRIEQGDMLLLITSVVSRTCHLIQHNPWKRVRWGEKNTHTHICDIISPRSPNFFFSLVLRKIKMFNIRHKLTDLSRQIDLQYSYPRRDTLYFPTSESILWPYWQPAGNFTCPEAGSPVVPVKFGRSSSWISTWKGERAVHCIHLSKL